MGKSTKRKPLKRNRPGIKRRARPLTDLLAIGEGGEPGRVYEKAKKAAEAGKNAKFVIFDLKKPNYKPPHTLNFISGDAVKFLENIHPASVKKIEDKYFIHHASFGKKGLGAKGQLKMLKKVLAETRLAQAGIRPAGKSTTFKIQRQSDKYLKLVKRALVPGGKFVLMTGAGNVSSYSHDLRETGFEVKSRALTRQQIMKSGSGQAIFDLKAGIYAHLIIATKPKLKTNNNA